jgi:putative transposase
MFSPIGIHKTHEYLFSRYSGIRQADVREIISRCVICALNKANETAPIIKPITSNCCMQRVQIDLMDFRTDADGEFEWVMQMKDHFSRFIWLDALEGKDSEEIAAKIEKWMGENGEPQIVQSDNGSEFKRFVYRCLERHRTHLINGRPYHPQSQGSVEAANGAFKRRLRAARLASGKSGWKHLLSDIARITNTTPHSALPAHVTPYEVFFGRPARFETVKADMTEVWVDWLEDDEQHDAIVRVSKVFT